MTLVELCEYTGAAAALAYLVLVSRRWWISWPLYVVSSILYVPVFAASHLYADAALQVYFIVMGLYAWWYWRRESASEVAVTSWPARRHLGILCVVVSAAFPLGYVLSATPAGSFAYADAMISVGSVTTTILTARKVIEGWYYWIVIDVAAVVLFYLKDLGLVTVALYVIYTILSVRALVAWRAAYAGEKGRR